MKLTIGGMDSRRFSLQEAFSFDEGTLFRAYNSSGKMVALAIRSRDNIHRKPMMVQLYEGGACIVFSEDPNYPFSFELLEDGCQVTLTQ